MPGFAALASAPLAAVAQAQRLGSASGGLAFEGAASGGAAARVPDASGAVVWASAAFGSVSATLRANDLLAVSGASVTVGAARAGSDRALPLLGHSTGAVRARLAAGSAFGLQAEVHGAVRADAGITGALVLSRLGSGDVDSVGAGARLLPLKGASAGRSAARLSSDQILNLSGASRADAAIAAGAGAGAEVSWGVTVSASAAIGAGMQPDLALGGSGYAISLQPLWARIDGALGLAGAALGHASMQASGARAFGLTGYVEGVAGVTGASTSQVDMARDSAGLAVSLAKVSSAISLRGRGDASAQPRGVASHFLPMSGSGRGWLPVNAQAASDHLVEGHGAGFVAVAGGASGAFVVTRALGVGVAIVSGAARDMPLLGQSAAKITTRASVTHDVIAIEGKATAASAVSGLFQSGLATHGVTTVRTTVASDANLVFAADLFVSASTPQQAAAADSATFSGAGSTLTYVSGTAFELLQLGGMSAGDPSLTATAVGTISFARSTLAVTQVEAVSARSIPFALEARVGNALSASAVATAKLAGHANAVLPAYAQAHAAFDLVGTAAADGGVASAGQTGLSLTGAARAEAFVGVAGRGVISSAGVGAIAAFVAGCSARSVHLRGSAAGHIPLTADAVRGKVDLGLSAALSVDVRAGVSGDIVLDGTARGQAVLSGETTGSVVLARFGTGDVIIASQSARVIVILGRASLSIASAGAANALFVIDADLRVQTTIGAELQQDAFDAIGQGAANIKSSGSAKPGAWPVSGRSAAFRAPPALQRSEPPRTGLSGRLLSSNSGRILRG
ncbi:MAG: hypothetical protein ACNA7M_09425 [Roseovarius sp.]